jgi:hypothetical protein
MWFMIASGLWHKLRPGRATRGKWRIPDGKHSEWCVFMFGARKVVAPAYVN